MTNQQDPELAFGTPPLQEGIIDPLLDESTNTDEDGGPKDDKTGALNDEDFIVVRLPKDKIGSALADAAREHKELNQAINSLAGTRVAREARSKVEALELELATIRRQKDEADIKSMGPEDLDSKYRTDPEFRSKVDALNQPAPSINPVKQAIDAAFQESIEMWGLDEFEVAEVEQMITGGKFDTNAEGVVIAPSDAIRNIRQELYNRSVAKKSPKAPEPQVIIPPKQPDQAKPDMAPMGNGAGTTTWTWEQVRRMNPDERIAAFPDEASWENAIRAGRVTGLSPEVKAAYGV